MGINSAVFKGLDKFSGVTGAHGSHFLMEESDPWITFLILTDDKHEALISTPAQVLKISRSFFLYFGKLFIFWRSVVGSPLWNRPTPLALLEFKSNGTSILVTSIFIILTADHGQTMIRPWQTSYISSCRASAAFFGVCQLAFVKSTSFSLASRQWQKQSLATSVLGSFLHGVVLRVSPCWAKRGLFSQLFRKKTTHMFLWRSGCDRRNQW